MDRRRWPDVLWFLFCAVVSSVWCITAAAAIGPTFDEPIYLEHGLQGWRDFSHSGLIRLGTMPLPVDVQTFPLFLWERIHGTSIDLQADMEWVLPWQRAGNLAFWLLLLWYGWKIALHLAGPWGARLAVAMLACEPNLLAHAALATTDIALTACLLALMYHFRVGRDAGWWQRVGVPFIWFGLAIASKASAIIYGPICLVVIEAERQVRLGRIGPLRSTFWDLSWIGVGGLAVAMVYCGSDFRPQKDFVNWANSLHEGVVASCMIWLADHLCIFSNGFEGIVRQIKHNMRGHGTYLLGESHPRSLWYYFPILLTIKLPLTVLIAPLVVAILGRARLLTNWACLTTLALLAFSLTFRVQIGIRLVLPLVAIATVGLSAALVNAAREPRWNWSGQTLRVVLVGGVLWMATSAFQLWPHGLCHVNELWGGTARGYELVSDSNYDWGQGLPELLAWQRENGAKVDVWYFGGDQRYKRPPLRDVPLHVLKVDRPQDVLAYMEGSYLAVSTTLVYGHVTPLESHLNAAAFLRQCKPATRTTTFLIYERQALIDAARRLSQFTPPQGRKAT